MAAPATSDGRVAAVGLATAAGGGDADAGRAGPGRRKVGGEVGEFTLPQGLVLLQAYPFGLHDRRRLVEQAGCPLGVGRHVIHPLPRMLRPGPACEVDRVRR